MQSSPMQLACTAAPRTATATANQLLRNVDGRILPADLVNDVVPDLLVQLPGCLRAMVDSNLVHVQELDQ